MKNIQKKLNKNLQPTSAPLFTVVGGLGMGGYSTVVKVLHLKTNIEYAMKVVTKNISDNQAKRENHKKQLTNELNFMTKVSPSPFLQRCHYCFESPTCVYFVVDLNTSGDLFHHLVNRVNFGTIFSEQEVRILLAELYLALEHLHKHNIVHRDVKIENVMLSAEGHVKLVDFGLAVEMTSMVEYIKPVGSLIYMAPELIKQRTGGRHTDWWAYGVLAHELLTGKSPWSSLTDKKVIKYEILNQPFSLSPPVVSPEASDFVKGLMCRDFEQRMGTKSDSEIKTCSFFSTIDWNQLARLELPPAFVPNSSVNVNSEDQDEAIRSYIRVSNHTISTPNNWSLGVEDCARFLCHN
jgi:serine/threonine protein kinase